MKKPVILMILDGFGVGLEAEKRGDAIKAAKKPNIDKLFAENPVTKIGASGLDVGLPDGQMGNSEVGHTNIGAGRIVYQELTRITKSIRTANSLRMKLSSRLLTMQLKRVRLSILWDFSQMVVFTVTTLICMLL